MLWRNNMNQSSQTHYQHPWIKRITTWALMLLILLIGTSNIVIGDTPEDYVPGQTYWGRNQYIEYIAGNMPIVISAPHGGYLTPSEIPFRTCGSSTGLDTFSQEYTRQVVEYLHQKTGRYPHVIINKLHRSRLDANRDIGEAACGNQWAEQAWQEYHAFIDAAQDKVAAQFSHGLYLDFHTNGHSSQWVELGYLLSSYDLSLSAQQLNTDYYKNKSSVKSLSHQTGVYFPELIRGPSSLGGLMQAKGYKSVPSPAYPDPNGASYYNGGYNTWVHGSRDGGTIDGIQVEVYWGMVTDSKRDAFSRALAESIQKMIDSYYDWYLYFDEHAYVPFISGQ